jgi:hypothetical protein
LPHFALESRFILSCPADSLYTHPVLMAKTERIKAVS